MIVAMKKATIIVQEKDVEVAIQDLRRLGVLHVEHQQAPQGKNVSVLQEEVALLDRAMAVFAEAGVLVKEEGSFKGAPSDYKSLAARLVELWKTCEDLEFSAKTLTNTIKEWQGWGDFDPGQIQLLGNKGVWIKLFQVPLKQIKEFPEDAWVKNIFTIAGLAHCLVISRRDLNLPFKELSLPKEGLVKMRKQLADAQKAIEAIRKEIRQSVAFYPIFIAAKKKIEKELELQQVLSGLGRSGVLSFVTGYLPFDAVEKVMTEAKQRKWGIVVSDPTKDDNIPVLIRNPKWVSVISPIFKFLEILPGYRELDISLPFLIFFSIFFGMLIGDAGYGMVYGVIALLLQKKARQKNQDTNIFFLFYILSGCAIIWGLLTGTFFGQEWFLKAGYKPLIPALSDARNVQRFCFFLGALHLSIAHAWRLVLKMPSLSALADVGWIGIIWAAFFVARMLILGDPYPFFGKWLIIAGVSLVILFTNPQKNILKTVAEGLGTLALSLMNSFTDVVSYIRLFEIGRAHV